MTSLPRTAIALLLVAALSATGCGGADAGGEITVTDARVPVPAGANGAAYLTLTNDADRPDRLVAASADIADAVEVHQSSVEDGMVAMQQVDGVAIPAGGRAVLEPGGFHLMLVGVSDGLAEGDTVELTLTFDGAAQQTIMADVVPPGDAGEMDMSSEG